MTSTRYGALTRWLPFILLAFLGAIGCAAEEKPPGWFPPGFLFGTAIAGFQADMGCPTLSAALCNDEGSDWYAYVTSPVTQKASNTFISGDSLSGAPGFWELYEQDFDRIAGELHNNGFRMSIEWSRIFPRATDGAKDYAALKALASPAALAAYHAMFEGLRRRGIRPLVTLNHYTLPLWIHDAVGCHENIDTCSPKGWVDRERTVREIAKYAGFVAHEFASQVDLWATLNEPLAIVLPGYVFQQQGGRTNPPAVPLQIDRAKVVLQALVEAHARMYDAIKQNDLVDADGDGKAAQVGVVYVMAPAQPADPKNAVDVAGARNVFYLFNMAYLNAVALGQLDGDLDGKAELRQDLVGRMDYIGLNYYTPAIVEGTTAPVLPQLSPLTTFNPLSLKLWGEYPRGIYEMAHEIKRAFGLPVIVTENGTNPPENTDDRERMLVQTLTWLSRAVAEGVDVRGYFYWTLMDNYEWNQGMSVRMGLYAVRKDDPQKKRTARAAAGVYGEIARQGSIGSALLGRFPTPP